ncbi:MAG: hypothetical protein OXB93_03155 [Cytophagales bacterium]|nr:hypothetical protein [Cytophagales bacterium]
MKSYVRLGSIVLSALLLGNLYVPHIQAQKLSKTEKKKWKKKIKELTPERYKSIMTEYYELRDHVASLEEQVGSFDERLAAKDKELIEAKKELPKLRNQLKNTQNALQKAQASGGGGGSGIPSRGVAFSVQIGALKPSRLDLSKHKKQPNFNVDKLGNVNRYSVGVFPSYREADVFKKKIRLMGVRDAWVVAYKNGRRVDLKEVLGSIKK